VGVTPTGLRARAAKFFGLDDDEIRAPGPASARVDALLAVVLFLLSALGLELARSAGGTISAHPIWAEYLALVAMAAPIAARRRWPLGVAVATSLAFFVVGVTMPDIAIQFSVQVLYFFALFSAMAWARSRRQAVVVMGGVLLLMFGWLAWQFSIGNGIDQINAARGAGAGARPEGVFSPIAAALTYTFLINIIYFGGATLGGQAAWRAGRQRAHLAEQTERLRAQAATCGSTRSSRSGSASPVSCTTRSPTTSPSWASRQAPPARSWPATRPPPRPPWLASRGPPARP